MAGIQSCLPGEPCGKELCPLWRHLGNYQLPESKKRLLSACKFQLFLDLTTFAEGQQRHLAKWAPPPFPLHWASQQALGKVPLTFSTGWTQHFSPSLLSKMAGPLYDLFFFSLLKNQTIRGWHPAWKLKAWMFKTLRKLQANRRTGSYLMNWRRTKSWTKLHNSWYHQPYLQ